MALDLGTTTGWAMHTDDGNIVSGTHGFKPGRFEGGGMRYLRFRGWLAEVLASAGSISAVYFEEVRRHAGVDAAHAYVGFLATLTAWWSLSGVLCARHSMTRRSMYAKQEDDEGGVGRSGGDAADSQGHH